METKTVEKMREAAENETDADAVVVTEYDDYLEVELLYHPPAMELQSVKTPLGIYVYPIHTERRMTEGEINLWIRSMTAPSDIRIEDGNGYYSIILRYEDGDYEW